MAQNYMLVPQQGVEPQDEWIRLGVEAHVAGKFPEAERCYRQALRLDPRNAVATLDFAILYAMTGNLNEGLLTIERASIFDHEQKYAVIPMNRALMLLDADRIDDALLWGRKGVEMMKDPKDIGPKLALALTLAAAGLASEAVPLYNEILDQEPSHALAGPNACFIQSLTSATPEDLLRQRKRWYDGHAFKGEKKKHRIDEEWPRPLRVGYVSGDFKSHSASMIFGNVLLNHDKEKVLPFFYSCLPVDPAADGMTKRFKDAAEDRWRDITGMSDADADELIRKDKIDILVDLAAHTNGGRLTLFTHKPAPVQVTAWGFAHGTGCPEIDWFFACPVSVPENERKFYAEKIYDLPSIITYDPVLHTFPADSAIPFRQNGYITFGNSARYEKMSDECLKTFAEILRRVPDSRLRLKDHAYRRPYAIRRVMDAMPDIEPERVQFLIATNHSEHMAAYRACDFGLDPFPHGGGVVAVEHLFMGVPLITLRGSQPAGRNTASVLTAMGREEWVANSPEEYVELAVKMADDANLKNLVTIRKKLKNEFLESPVVKDYCRRVEEAYADIWERKLRELGILEDEKPRRLKVVG